MQILPDPCRKPTHDTAQPCNFCGQDNSSSNALASFRSAVSNPSVNQSYTGEALAIQEEDYFTIHDHLHRESAELGTSST